MQSKTPTLRIKNYKPSQYFDPSKKTLVLPISSEIPGYSSFKEFKDIFIESIIACDTY